MANLCIDGLIALVAAAYWYAGCHMWACLISQIETPEDVALLAAGPEASPWIAAGQAAMIVSWPLWAVLPAVWFAIRDVTRGA